MVGFGHRGAAGGVGNLVEVADARDLVAHHVGHDELSAGHDGQAGGRRLHDGARADDHLIAELLLDAGNDLTGVRKGVADLHGVDAAADQALGDLTTTLDGGDADDGKRAGLVKRLGDGILLKDHGSSPHLKPV